EAHVERGQKGDDIGRLSEYFLLQDHLAAIVDHAHRRCLYRHVQTNEMLHLIAPSSMIEVARPRSAITRERGRALIIKGEPHPPRYTILTGKTGSNVERSEWLLLVSRPGIQAQTR